MAVCSRETYAAKSNLPPEDWSFNGVYVLSAPWPDNAVKTRVRPGTTQTRPLLERVDQHLRAEDKQWWRQVVLVRRLTRQFDNAEAGFLRTPCTMPWIMQSTSSDTRMTTAPTLPVQATLTLEQISLRVSFRPSKWACVLPASGSRTRRSWMRWRSYR